MMKCSTVYITGICLTTTRRCLSLSAHDVTDEVRPDTLVPTDGGRYDVNVHHRRRQPVYWESAPVEVRRCSWFFKATTDGRYIPYEENLASKLEVLV